MPASRVNVVMAALAAFHIGHRLIGPVVELLGKGTVLRVKKRNAQMRGAAHAGSPGCSEPLNFACKQGHNHPDGKSLHFLPFAADWLGG